MWTYNYTNELYHYGIRGMKWGVRRYQNKDGSYTSAGKKRRSADPETIQKRKATAKKVAVGTVAVIGVTAAAVYLAKNPQAAKFVGNKIKSIGNTPISAVKGAKEGAKEFLNERPKKTAAEKGKAFGKKAMQSIKTGKDQIGAGVKEGVKQGLEASARGITKSVIVGGTMVGAKRMLDAAIGKEETARIFQANNKDKISSFWKVNDPRDKDEDDD